MIATRFHTVKRLTELLQAKGTRILAILSEDGDLPFDRIPEDNERVRWTCARDDKPQESQFKSLKRSLSDKKKDEILCQSHAISKSRGGPTYEDFVSLLEKEDWKMETAGSKFDADIAFVTIFVPELVPSL